jgi:G3E family GTPase
MRTPLTLVTGPLGSGKTTLLRHILDSVQMKIAILLNEFGEIAIDRNCFEEFADHLTANVYRAKGFIRFSEGTHLFNFVAGRWELDSFREEKTALVFISRDIKSQQSSILAQLANCEG